MLAVMLLAVRLHSNTFRVTLRIVFFFERRLKKLKWLDSGENTVYVNSDSYYSSISIHTGVSISSFYYRYLALC